MKEVVFSYIHYIAYIKNVIFLEVMGKENVPGTSSESTKTVPGTKSDTILGSNADTTKKSQKRKADFPDIKEEALLRRRKLEEAISQQRELHLLKLEAAKAERDYWLKKRNVEFEDSN